MEGKLVLCVHPAWPQPILIFEIYFFYILYIIQLHENIIEIYSNFIAEGKATILFKLPSIAISISKVFAYFLSFFGPKKDRKYVNYMYQYLLYKLHSFYI